MYSHTHVCYIQRQGRLPWVSANDSQCSLSLSKYGIKVTDMKKLKVHARHPLHWIVNITYYEDTYGKHMLALRQSKLSGGSYNDLYIYECKDEVRLYHCVLNYKAII